MSEQDQQAGAGPVERPVRPAAWLRADGMKAITDDELQAWRECGKAELVEDYTVPLYGPQSGGVVAELQAEWTPDCQGKQDYDAGLVSLSTRYWPRGGGYAEMTTDGRWLENDARPSISPSATATIYLQDERLTSASFEGATEAEVKAKVEAWAREQFARVVSAMRIAFRA